MFKLTSLFTSLTSALNYYELNTNITLSPDTKDERLPSWVFKSSQPDSQELWLSDARIPNNTVASNSSLVITDINYQNEGLYKCRLDSKTSCGEFNVRVGSKPIAPSNLICISYDLDKYMDCTWQVDSPSLTIETGLTYKVVENYELNTAPGIIQPYEYENSIPCQEYCNKRKTCCRFDLSNYMSKTKAPIDDSAPSENPLASFVLFVYTENSVGKSFYLDQTTQDKAIYVYPQFMMVPSKPESIVTQDVQATEARIIVSPPNKDYYRTVHNEYIQLIYSTQYKKTSSNTWIDVSEDTEECLLKSLDPNTSYQVRSRVRPVLTKLSSAFQWSDWSKTTSFTTKIDFSKTTLQNLYHDTVRDKDSFYNITLNWSPLDVNIQDSSINYAISYYSCYDTSVKKHSIEINAAIMSYSHRTYANECLRVKIHVLDSNGYEITSPVEDVVNLKFDDGQPLYGPSVTNMEADMENIYFDFINRDDTANVSFFRANLCQTDSFGNCITERVMQRITPREKNVYEKESFDLTNRPLSFCLNYKTWLTTVQGESNDSHALFILNREVDSEKFNFRLPHPENVMFDIKETSEQNVTVEIGENNCREMGFVQYLRLDDGQRIYIPCSDEGFNIDKDQLPRTFTAQLEYCCSKENCFIVGETPVSVSPVKKGK